MPTVRYLKDIVRGKTHYFKATLTQHGWSLFTLQPFRRGQAICRYPGRLMQVQRAFRVHRRELRAATPITNMLQVNRTYVLVPRSNGHSIGRLINAADTRRGQVANCKYAIDRRSKKVTVVATRAIKAGDELLAAYGTSLTSALNRLARQRAALGLPEGRPSRIPYGMCSLKKDKVLARLVRRTRRMKKTQKKQQKKQQKKEEPKKKGPSRKGF